MTITYEVGRGLYVNLTNRCTNACDFCVRSNGAEFPYGDLWLEREPTYEEALADILRRQLDSYDELVFCGYGEPALRLDDILKIAREVKKISAVKIRMNTNCQANLIYGRDVTPELHGLIDELSVSLNAADAVKYNEICHSEYGEAAYDALLEFARSAAKYVPSVVLSVVRTTLTDADIEVCRKTAEKLGVALRIREYIK